MMVAKIDPGSNLATLARINPLAAANYADAILQELDEIVKHCTVADPTTSGEELFAQVHALKNAVAPIGDHALIVACTGLLGPLMQGERRAEMATQFRLVAAAAATAVADYRCDFRSTASIAAASSFKPSGL
ncbi:hypothetical protein [Xanthomonas euvesicatoria]|uniref:hypothetical protein n=1 Tax=Xanthomonas euvesicatoria TaxID=456327 RepID=UPI001C496FE6|nr:hypothetical protein [Xanthomonas euvesicatoria]MBV6800004.1 hypothetical protein [Xanthomonas campestris pv. obscurae]